MKIKVRIAVAANSAGEWNAYGFHNGDDWHDVMDAFETLADEQRFWVTAEIEVSDDVPEIAGASESAMS